ncbi:hypothetical protein Tco_0360150 [Tanacetum coccineum]
MLKKPGLEDFKPTKTPMSTEIKLTKDDKADSVDNTKYRGPIMLEMMKPNYKSKTLHWVVKSPTYVNLTSSSEELQNERTPSPSPRGKSLSPPNEPSKSTSSRSTYQTTSSSSSESPTPTHVAPPPKLRFAIPMKLEPKELPLQQTPPRFSHPPPGF